MLLIDTPGMYDEVRQHLKDMLEVGEIRPSSSPWALLVILVCKKDGKLWFCIDLHSLKEMTIKDAYSILQIQDTLDCVWGAVWFTSLDLMSGY